VLEVLNLEPLATVSVEASPTATAHLPAPSKVASHALPQGKPVKASGKAPKNDTPTPHVTPDVPTEALPADSQQQALLNRLSLTQPMLLDELIALCGLPINEIQTCLTLLELEGWLHRPTSITVQRLK
jgi:predicted Rossmann fold nucleotide-binding protein DprA/Smf involved in DNA uptake